MKASPDIHDERAPTKDAVDGSGHEVRGQVESSEPPFDSMFPQLVKEADTAEHKLIGYIGFGLFHDAKREWTSTFRQREGRYPSYEEIQAYERSWTASRKEALQNAAAQLVATYADALVSHMENQILRSALRGSFFRYVGRWLFSAALYTLALIAIGAALLWSGVELPKVLERPREMRSVTRPELAPSDTAPQAAETPPEPPRPSARPRKTQ